MNKFLKEIIKISDYPIENVDSPQKKDLGVSTGPTSGEDGLGRINPLEGPQQVVDSIDDVLDNKTKKLSEGEKIVFQTGYDDGFGMKEAEVIQEIADGIFLINCPDCKRKLHIAGIDDMIMNEDNKQDIVEDSEKIDNETSKKNYETNENVDALNLRDKSDDPNKNVGTSGDSSDISYIAQ